MNMSDKELSWHEATLRDWTHKDPIGLLRYLRGIWAYADWGWDEADAYEEDACERNGVGQFRRYCISTAGWSDNEALMEAVEQNRMFWSLFWYLSRRGGHYEFRVPARFLRPTEEK